MKRKIKILMVLLLVSFGIMMEAARPVVKIQSPPGGWTLDRKIKIKGTISDPTIQLATMVVNGTDILIRIANGVFDQNVILSNGQNTVTILVRNKEGEGKDTVVFYTSLSKMDIQLHLTFPPQPFYVDLWITQPDGEKCYWASRETKAGGVLHDLYQDAPGGGVGMGSQCYTMANALSGEYLIQVNYWAGGQWGEGETPEGPYGKMARTPIVPIRVDVILYEGTEYEVRKQYNGVLKKPSDTYTVGKLLITPIVPADENKTIDEIKSYDKKK